MANTKISNLTASASNLAASDLVPVVQTPGVGPVKMTGTQIKTGIIGAGSVSIASGKTLTVNNTLTLAGTDGTTMTFPSTSATLAGLGIANVFTQPQTFQPSIDGQAGTFRRLNGTQTSNILELQTEANAFLAGFDKSGLLTLGAASTQTGILKMAGTTSGTVSLSVADAAGTWTMKLPNSGGTNGFILTTDGSGNTSWTNPTALGIDLDVGSTAITNGTTGRILYDNAGTLGEALLTYSAATLQLGAGDAAAPVAQTLLIQSGSGTDINGVAFNIGGSKSTGTGTAGLVNIQTSSRGAASGTSQNVLATVASFGPNTLSGSQAISLLDMAQTWNTSGAPTAIKLNVTNTSSPTNSFLISLQNNGTNQFAVRADTGACFIGTPTSDLNNYTLMTVGNDLYVNSKSVTSGGLRLCTGTYAYAYLKSVGVSGARFQLGNATPFGWTDNVEGAAGTFDTILARDAANTLALRNSTAAQTFRVYNTYTSSTNYETFKIDWITTANTCLIGTQKGSSGGSARALAFQTDGTTRLTIETNGDLTIADAENIIVGSTTGTKIGTATSQKIGFWNATPIVQPTTGVAEAAFVENSGGTAVNVDSTFGGYTLQQVVQALQNAGLLA